MSAAMYFIPALFLPLFPLSMIFNALFARLKHPLPRTLLLLLWPQLGVAALYLSAAPVPVWVVFLAVLTSLFYGVRALALREMGLWTSFLATSSWALLWIWAHEGADDMVLHFYALSFSVPLVLMALLTAGLERRFGAAYAGLYGGLAQVLPRFSGVLVFVVLAVIATPLFPTFFAMLATIVTALPAAPALGVGVAFTWLIWSWAGARLLQDMLVGPGKACEARDLSLASTWVYAAVMLLLVAAGLAWMGGMR